MSEAIDLSTLPKEHPVLRLIRARLMLCAGMSTVHNFWTVGSSGLLHAHYRTPLPNTSRPEVYDDAAFMAIQTKEAHAALCAAVFVLAYTVVSEVLQELCVLSSECEPAAWMQVKEVAKLDVKVSALFSQGIDHVYRQTVKRFVDDIEMMSLPRKCAAIWGALGPVDTRQYLTGYSYNHAELERLNSLRVKCVHGWHFRTPIAELRDKVKTLHNTARFFGMLVQKRHSLSTGNATMDEWP
jgi:hypothetical protein